MSPPVTWSPTLTLSPALKSVLAPSVVKLTDGTSPELAKEIPALINTRHTTTERNCKPLFFFITFLPYGLITGPNDVKG
jgi:hypothetical protein